MFSLSLSLSPLRKESLYLRFFFFFAQFLVWRLNGPWSTSTISCQVFFFFLIRLFFCGISFCSLLCVALLLSGIKYFAFIILLKKLKKGTPRSWPPTSAGWLAIRTSCTVRCCKAVPRLCSRASPLAHQIQVFFLVWRDEGQGGKGEWGHDNSFLRKKPTTTTKNIKKRPILARDQPTWRELLLHCPHCVPRGERARS